MALPAFGNLVFTLDDSSQELDSGFYNLEGGLTFSSRIDPDRNISVFGGANIFIGLHGMDIDLILLLEMVSLV